MYIEIKLSTWGNTTLVDDPVLNVKSFHLNSNWGGYIVLVSIEKYLNVFWLLG